MLVSCRPSFQPLGGLGRQGAGLEGGRQAQRGHAIDQHLSDAGVFGGADRVGALGDLADVDHGAGGGKSGRGGIGETGRGYLQRPDAD
jgi:hypothetical protein